jgi:hypothetical protein
MHFTLTKLTSTFIVIALIAFGYFAYSVIGDATINVSLKTNPTLETGLVGHWTFDGKDTTSDYGNYTYKRTLTISAGGTSGGAATTTTNGYAILATTTLTTLKSAANGGNIHKLDSNNLPVDIAFTNTSKALLDFHIESYDSSTGAIVAWIEVDDISSTTPKTFNMYYGDGSAGDVSDEAGTYNSTYAGVWHLGHDGTATTSTPDFLDSTSNNNDGTSVNMNATDLVTGQIDGALDFDGVDDYINAGNDSSLTTMADNTSCVWLDITGDGGATYLNIVGIDDEGYELSYLPSTDKFEYWVRTSTGWGSTPSRSTGTYTSSDGWLYVCGVYNSIVHKLYINGVDQTDGDRVGTGDIVYVSPDLWIGDDNSNEPFNGLVDEARIYNTAIHAMDILTDYNMGVDNTTFLSWGSEVAVATSTDSSGQGNDGTPNGSVKTLGKIGQAFDFDGSNDYISIGNAGSGVKTIAFWMKADDITTRKVIDIDGTDQIELDGSSNVTATSFPAGTVYVDGSSASATVTTGWHHVVITDTTGVNASAMDIGRVSTGYFDGQIDDVRIYNRALSAEEVKRLYGLGATTHTNVTLKTNPTLETGLVGHWTFDGKDMISNVADVSGQGNHGALQGQTSTTTAIGVIGQALSFDGSNDYVDLGQYTMVNTLSGASAVSASMWINFDTSSDATWSDAIIHINIGSGNAAFYVGLTGASDNVYVAGRSQNTDSLQSDSSSGTVTQGQWTHVVGILDYVNDQISMAINGVLEAPASATFGSNTLIPTSGGGPNDRIGDVDGSGDFPFDGLIDDVRIYNRALSAEEVTRLYNLGK